MGKLDWPAWSPENGFFCWTWIKGVVDYGMSYVLGNFYTECKSLIYCGTTSILSIGIFKSLAVFIAEYFCLEKVKPVEAAVE